MVLLFWMLEYKCRGSGTGQARGQPRSVLDPPTSETPLGLPLPPWTATVLNNTPTPPPPRATTRRKRKSGRCKTPERPSTQSAALGRTGDPGPTPRRAPVRRGRENGTAPLPGPKHSGQTGRPPNGTGTPGNIRREPRYKRNKLEEEDAYQRPPVRHGRKPEPQADDPRPRRPLHAARRVGRRTPRTARGAPTPPPPRVAAG